jgi:hypothetical protein
VIFQINDMRLTTRLANAAAATAITAMILVCVGLGFSAPARAETVQGSAGVPLMGRFE